jgi:hypothetical protein
VAAGHEGDQQRLDTAFRLALSRSPSSEEAGILLELHRRHLEQYREDTESAESLLSLGDSPRLPDVEAASLAAWTSVARVILNLPECIMRY